MNGRARKTIVVYKGQEYVFDYCRQAINYFKEFKGEPITVNWICRFSINILKIERIK